MHTQLLYWLGHASWRASLLAVMVLVAQLVFRRHLTAGWRYNLWLLVALGFLLPFSLKSSLSIFNVLRPSRSPQRLPVPQTAIPPQASPPLAHVLVPAARLESRESHDQTASMPAVQDSNEAAIPQATAKPVAEAQRASWDRDQGLALVWLGGACCLAVVAAVSGRRFARRLCCGKTVSDAAILGLFNECKARMKVSRPIGLLATDAVSTPALYGLWRPRLLLPLGMTEALNREHLRFVFLHELAHLRRRDIAANWLTTCLQIVHWFNPVAWLVFHRMRRDRELACDALVLGHTEAAQRKMYGETILRLLEAAGGRMPTPGLVGILENKHGLRERIHLIARFRAASGRSRWAPLLILALGLGGLTDALTEEPKSQVTVQPEAPLGDQWRRNGTSAEQAENWRKLAAAPDDLSGRGGNTAIWTGSELLVFGGEGLGVSYANGARYSVAENTWAMLPREEAPSSRTQHSAVWTGREMIIWGGFGGIWGVNTNRGDGARFNPQTGTWRPVTPRDAPMARFQHSAVWSGQEMLIWGGYTDAQSIYQGAYNDACLNSGGRYDPASDTWQHISTSGAPSKRFNHAALWTGERMLIWGGNDETKALNDGGLYDPITDTWRPISTRGAPSPRKQPLAVWTGREMIVWGGASRDDSRVFEDGARYDPATDRWTPISTTGAPKGRVFASALWTGAEMVFWGGVNDPQANGVSDPGRYVGTGGRYNPTTDTWVGFKSSGFPSARATSAVWTGNGMLIFGGYNGAHLNDAYFLVGSAEASPRWAEASRAVRVTSGEPSPLAQGIVKGRYLAQWLFAQKDGDLVPDATGQGYDARIHGQPRLVPHWGENQALEFDGSGNNAAWSGDPQNCGLSIAKRLTQGFTELSVEAWLRKTPAAQWMPIIYRDLWDSSSGFGLYCEWNSGKVVFGHYDSSGHNQAQSETTVQDGRWHHVVGTMQPVPGQGQGYLYRIYVDGQLDVEQTGTRAVQEAPPEGGILMIAYPNSSGADHAYQGALDRIAIYNVALTPAQIKVRFESGRE